LAARRGPIVLATALRILAGQGRPQTPFASPVDVRAKLLVCRRIRNDPRHID
jgi:hypothetical protein